MRKVGALDLKRLKYERQEIDEVKNGIILGAMEIFRQELDRIPDSVIQKHDDYRIKLEIAFYSRIKKWN